ncbi:hypothetical protein AKO1_010385, partial [Acrasis kona]
MSNIAKLQKVGDSTFGRIEKINSELLTMTYGSLVTQLLRDFEDTDAVNKQLEKMGHKIGVRLIEEYMAKSNPSAGSCKEFKDTAEAIAKVGFKMFLGFNAQVTSWNQEQTQFSLVFQENPLNDFVELPERLKTEGLFYSNLLCGVIRGALEMVQMRVECIFVKCPLRGDDVSEIKVTLIDY